MKCLSEQKNCVSVYHLKDSNTQRGSPLTLSPRRVGGEHSQAETLSPLQTPALSLSLSLTTI